MILKRITPHRPINRLLEAAQRRFRSARPGSVLILVIVLLVLLALLGTAYLSTTRNDRLSSVASMQNSTVDQYVDGVSNVVQGRLLDALFDHSGLYAGPAAYRYHLCDRGAYSASLVYEPGDVVIGSNGGTYLCTVGNGPAPATPSNPATGGAGWSATFFRNFDSIGFNSGSLIAERHPAWDAAHSVPFWSGISPALLSTNPIAFECPDLAIGAQPAFVTNNLYPTYNATGYPALTLGFGGNIYTACDADGDGVADSFMSRIPGAYSDGLTWYVGTRILDDNSAINANTAWSSTIDNYGLFPTSVGLGDLLSSPDTIASIQNYRANGGDGIHPVDDCYSVAGNVRTDYQFLNPADALNSQLIRRLKNPGYGATGAATVGARYNAIPESETAAMAYGFVLRNPYAPVKSMLETMLPTSLGGAITPYNSGTIASWFTNNFNYPTDAPTVAKPLRSMVVSRNPVSNYIPAIYDPNNIGEPINLFMLPYSTGNAFFTGVTTANYNHYKGVFDPVAKTAYNSSTGATTSTFGFNDIVVENGRSYICVGTNTGIDPQAGPSMYGSYTYWQLQPWTSTPVKSNVNTATFRELFRAYWSVMAGAAGNVTPFGSETVATNYSPSYNPYTTTDPQRMFRSSLRDPNYATTANANIVTRFDSCNMMLLRAAMAAVNTVGLRNQSQDVVSRTIRLNATIGGAPAPGTGLDNYGGPQSNSTSANVEVRVYSNAPNPCITEVYADNDTSAGQNANSGGKSNPKGYIGIELYNPYNFPISTKNWQFATMTRTPGASFTPMTLTAFPALTAAIPLTMAPHSCLLFENYNPTAPGGNDAAYRPSPAFPLANATGLIGTSSIYVAGLDAVTSLGELVLLRTRRADGTITFNFTDPLNNYAEGNLFDLIPVDSYDFTGFPQPAVANTSYNYWHYTRGKEQAVPGAGNAFKCIYPGMYSAAVAAGSPRLLDTIAPPAYSYPPGPPALVTAANFLFVSAASVNSQHPFPPIQIYNQGMPGPNPLVASAGNPTPPLVPPTIAQFPFGAFARNGDIMDVPYIGAYRVNTVGIPAQIIELNSLPMDAAFADDADTTAVGPATSDDANENIGRFCPIASPQVPNTVPADYYSWARNLFTYLTVQNPPDDYMPSFDPGADETSTAEKYSPPPSLPAGASLPASALPSPVNSADATLTNHTAQDNVGQDGLININTAPWKVLASLNLVPGNPAANQSLAQAIVAYRQQFGPYTSITDLNKVYDVITPDTTKTFQNGWGTQNLAATPTALIGILAPADNFPNAPTGTVTSGVAHDFQGDFANLTRISNLITTRSDTYTVYICVEGWQNANTANAALKVVRRYAFVADRSAVNGAATNLRYLKTLAVPNN